MMSDTSGKRIVLAPGDPRARVLVLSFECQIDRHRVTNGGGERWRVALDTARRQLAAANWQVRRMEARNDRDHRSFPRPRAYRARRRRSCTRRPCAESPPGEPDQPPRALLSPSVARGVAEPTPGPESGSDRRICPHRAHMDAWPRAPCGAALALPRVFPGGNKPRK